MKNKSIKTNSMKLKKVIAASLAISVLLAFTGCGSASSSTNNKKQESTSSVDAGSTDELNDLYQQENQLFADHKDAWDKVFGFMSKNTDGDAMSENYADVLASTVESNKDSFSEEEYETLSKDIETIRGIEEEIGEGDVRTVLHFHPALAPVKIGVLPLSKKLNEGAEKIFAELSKKYNCEFDDRGNIGKRYRRQDEIGTPFCVTYDFDSETDGCVTVRFRDSMEQERVAIADLDAYFADKFSF